MSVSPLPTLGVVVVSFNASDVILDCLESLLAATGVTLHIVVVDNDSTDGSAELIESWAAGRHIYAPSGGLPFAITPAPKPLDLHMSVPEAPTGPTLTLIRAGVNGGFAGGVNIGLAAVAQIAEVDRFWVLNPDSVVPPQTPAHFATYQVPGDQFSLMGGRVTYVDPPERIQSDGGVINRRTGVASNLNFNTSIDQTPPAKPKDLDYISGANMVASRAFYEAVGPMREDYFLYYEEVDWAWRRGDMPLAICPDARVYHHAGTAIGSPTADRIASPFSIYFLYRGRLRFMRRFFPKSLWIARGYAVAKAGQIFARGFRAEARALLAAALRRSPPKAIHEKLSPEAAKIAFAAPKD